MNNARLSPFPFQVEGEKRQHIPYVLKAICECGELITINLAKDNHISYALFGNSLNKVYYLCDHCGKDYVYFLKLKIIAELVDVDQS